MNLAFLAIIRAFSVTMGLSLVARMRMLSAFLLLLYWWTHITFFMHIATTASIRAAIVSNLIFVDLSLVPFFMLSFQEFLVQ